MNTSVGHFLVLTSLTFTKSGNQLYLAVELASKTANTPSELLKIAELACSTEL